MPRHLAGTLPEPPSSSSKRRKFDSDTDSPSDSAARKRHKHSSRRRRRHSTSDTESETESSDSRASESDSRHRRRRRDKESEKDRQRRKEKERKRRKEKEREKERKRKEKERKKKKKEKAAKGAVTETWGRYGIIRETDMWNKRPEFTAWLLEVKKMNLETLANWEEKQMFKDFMEDHNTATFPSKKYYDLDAYYHRQLEKEIKKGSKGVKETERIIFDDEEQRRLELMKEREKHKEEQIEALKRSMQTGMAQAMKEQSRLREEMAYQYKLGNFEAAAAIQKRLDPDAPP